MKVTTVDIVDNGYVKKVELLTFRELVPEIAHFRAMGETKGIETDNVTPSKFILREGEHLSADGATVKLNVFHKSHSFTIELMGNQYETARINS